MDKIESIMILRRMLKKNFLLYVEHKVEGDGSSIGRFYIQNNEGIYDATFDIAWVMDAQENIVILNNSKTNQRVKCLKNVRTESFLRDLSETIFDNWQSIKFHCLWIERIF